MIGDDASERSLEGRGAMIFELWELASANLIAQFDAEGDALRFVRAVLRDQGSEAIASWELVRAWENRDSEVVAAGATLAERARDHISA